MSLYTFHTSLRSRALADTLHLARAKAATLGISRVTEITRLDHVGMPVAASIRPDAMEGSLCVQAGKGMNREEAFTGAYMEAIEAALAEPGRAGIPVYTKAAKDILDCASHPDRFLELCPRQGASINMSDAIDLVEATDFITGKSFLIPAELVFVPYPAAGKKGKTWFGSSSNGLASGNNREEAITHALFELIERDAMSFQAVRDTSRILRPDSFPAPIRAMEKKLSKAGLQLLIRHMDHSLGLPYFMAVIVDTVFENPVYLSAGYGCHNLAEVALMRAASEAIQSRLSFIHGGRDDLTDAFRGLRNLSEEQKQLHFQQLHAALQKSDEHIALDEVSDVLFDTSNAQRYLQSLVGHLQQQGFAQILTVALTPPEDALQVVKVVVPRLEHYSRHNKRIGPRLKSYIEQVHAEHLRRTQPAS